MTMIAWLFLPITRLLMGGLQNLYIASYVHHIDDMEPEESHKLIDELLAHVSKPKYRVSVAWEQNGDMIIWDNTAVRR